MNPIVTAATGTAAAATTTKTARAKKTIAEKTLAAAEASKKKPCTIKNGVINNKARKS